MHKHLNYSKDEHPGFYCELFSLFPLPSSTSLPTLSNLIWAATGNHLNNPLILSICCALTGLSLIGTGMLEGPWWSLAQRFGTEQGWVLERRSVGGRGLWGVVCSGSVGAWGGVGTRPGFCPWGGEVGTTRGRVYSTEQLNCSATNGECRLQLKANSALAYTVFHLHG